jgi:hypothetical protein
MGKLTTGPGIFCRRLAREAQGLRGFIDLLLEFVLLPIEFFTV